MDRYRRQWKIDYLSTLHPQPKEAPNFSSINTVTFLLEIFIHTWVFCPPQFRKTYQIPMKKHSIVRLLSIATLTFGLLITTPGFGAPASSKKKGTPSKAKTEEKSSTNSADTAELKKANELLKELSTSKKTSLTKLLNSGKKEDLVKLPGIGDTTAELIIKARPLESSAHLILIKGIGEKTFADIVKSRK